LDKQLLSVGIIAVIAIVFIVFLASGLTFFSHRYGINSAGQATAMQVSEDPYSATVSDLTLAAQYYTTNLQSVPTATDAKNRKEVMLALAQKDQQAFLQNSVPAKIRAKLPVDIQADVERQVSLQGTYTILHGDNFDTHTSIDSPVLIAGTEMLNVVSPVSSSVPMGSTVSASGYALDSLFVGDSTGVQFVGSPEQSTVPASSRRVLAVLVNYLDSPPAPFTKTEAESFMRGSVRGFYLESSYGKFTYNADVVGWITLPKTSMRGNVCSWGAKGGNPSSGSVQTDSADYGLLLSEVAKQTDLNNYDTILVIPSVNCDPRLGGWAPLDRKVNGKYLAVAHAFQGYAAYDYGPQKQYKWAGLYMVISHELGHTLSLQHASGRRCNSALYNTGGCIFEEYGNTEDVMGSGYRGHFDTPKKISLGWLDSSSVLDIKQSGLYTIGPYEATSGKRYARMFGGSNFPYIEYRSMFGYPEGLSVVYAYTDSSWLGLAQEHRDILIKQAISKSNYIDYDGTMTPGDPGLIDIQTGITIGPVWSMDASGITFEVRYIDSGPYTTLQTSANAVTAGGTVTLTWESAPDATCVASSTNNVWSGSKARKGSEVVAIYSPNTFKLVCTAPGGSSALLDGTTRVSTMVSTTKAVMVGLNYASPIQSFTASPSVVASGGSSTLDWQAAPLASCFGSWVNNQPVATSGSYLVQKVTKTYSYSLSCSWSGQIQSQSVTISVDSSGKTGYIAS